MEPYFIKNDARSILCVPILSKNEPIAIIYLENTLTLGAFTNDRIELLKLLSWQIVISLQNSLLYSNLEQKVEDRTEEVVRQKDVLEATLRDLKSTQSQLIQSEKKKINPEGYDPKIWIKTELGSDHCIIRIRDNGMGISEKIINKIFQPFFSTKPTGQGTGIGLSLS